NGLNNSAHVVGYAYVLDSSRIAPFLWENGVMIDLNSLIPADSGWELFIANDINDVGQITGIGLMNGTARPVLLNPVSDPTAVPEPLTLLGSATALGFGALFKREYSRRQKKTKQND
ncbi:MAG: PEP-CTERM sorting domain-containing protein, partial [Coleofasciculus sp. C2-GNP5-27]